MTSGRRNILEANLSRVRDLMAAAAAKAGRSPDEIRLQAVTKYVTAGVVRDLHALGLRDFAESTVQKLAAKAEELDDLSDIRWYMIGHLQRNKVARCLRHVRGIHSVDSLRLLEEIGLRVERRGVSGPDLYIEVNAGEESQKTGLAPGELPGVLGRARDLSSTGCAVAGLMTMAPYSECAEDSRPYFRRLRVLRDESIEAGLLPSGAGLSMGMSADFTVAIEEGATVVRVGSALFEETGGGP